MAEKTLFFFLLNSVTSAKIAAFRPRLKKTLNSPIFHLQYHYTCSSTHPLQFHSIKNLLSREQKSNRNEISNIMRKPFSERDIYYSMRCCRKLPPATHKPALSFSETHSRDQTKVICTCSKKAMPIRTNSFMNCHVLRE